MNEHLCNRSRDLETLSFCSEDEHSRPGFTRSVKSGRKTSKFRQVRESQRESGKVRKFVYES